jgi:hypothetical protein
MWKKAFGGEKKDEGWSVVEDAAGNYFITGYTESFTHEEEDSDMWLLKIDKDGNKIWTRNYGSIKDDGGYAGAVVTNDGYATAGYTYVQNQGTNFYLLRIDNSGLTGDDTEAPTVPQNVTATVISSSQIDLSWDNSNDNVAVVGYIVRRNGDFVDSTQYTSFQDTNLTAETEYSYTISAYDAAGNESDQSTSISATTTNIYENVVLKLNIYPNPIINKATIVFDNSDNSVYTLSIINTEGQIVKTIHNITDNKITINKENLQSGIYLIKIDGEKLFSGRLIIK